MFYTQTIFEKAGSSLDPGVEPKTFGANPTTAIYDASVVKSYNATNSVVRF
jgi:hypothetical protein